MLIVEKESSTSPIEILHLQKFSDLHLGVTPGQPLFYASLLLLPNWSKLSVL